MEKDQIRKRKDKKRRKTGYDTVFDGLKTHLIRFRPKGATSFCKATKMKQKMLFWRQIALFAMAKSQ